MIIDSTAEPDLRAVRARWRQASRHQPPAVLRIGLLASYTIDPLVPYLGIGLHDAGLPATFGVGPFNQITQQCLDDDSDMARLRPDVLVVAPRFDELGPPAACGGWADELMCLADIALDAAGRWRSCLVFVLPAVPESRPCGIGDAGSPGGVMAAAATAREAVRRALAGRPGVCLADAEEAVRAVGAARALAPALFQFAKIPYTEELFAGLGAQLGRLLRVRYGRGHRVAVIDADSLVLAGGEGVADREAMVSALRSPLLDLHAAGVRLALRGSGAAGSAWEVLAAGFPELLRGLLEGWVLDDRSAADQLRTIAAEAGESVGALLLVTTDPVLAAEIGTRPDQGRAVVLGEQPESWPAELRAAGLFDQAPEPVAGPPPTTAAPAPRAKPAASLADFVASLNVVVTHVPVGPGNVDKVAELVERAKDFTLGNRHSAADIAQRADELLALAVRDRLGEYGISAAVGMRVAAGVCAVDLFSVSCPVLGKEVEDAVLAEVVERAARAGCDTVVVGCRDTGVNTAALRFLRAAAARVWTAGSGQAVRVRVELGQRD